MVFSNFIMQALQDETVGQEYAVAALTRAVTLSMAGLRRRADVAAVLVFIGPPSSGKNHMARALTRVLTGSEKAMTCINCQQIEQSDSPRATGNRPDSGYLHRQIWFDPAPGFNVVVFEEIDKAPPAFRDDLALAIDRGAIWTPGLAVSFRNSFVILISELSRRKADQLVGRTIGFLLDAETEVEMSRRQAVVLEEVDARLGQRLVSRIDEIVVFDRLNEQNIVTLLERQISAIEAYLSRFYIGFIIEQEAKTFLLKGGLEDLNHGARQITRVVRNYLEFPLADLMLSRRLVPGTTAIVRYDHPRSFLHFEIMTPSLAASPAGRAQAARA
ncbi:MAG TPA: AAA family ATPase [Blastocatellia bacterium]|nr:AAA family ATPase [Blastocatellia bacterium]